MNEEFPPLGSSPSPPASASASSPPPSLAPRQPLNVRAAEFVPSAAAYTHTHFQTPTTAIPDANQQYNDAVNAFDEMFPSLGAASGSTSPSKKKNANASAATVASSSSHISNRSNGTNITNITSMNFVNKQRLMSLREKFGWLNPENVKQILEFHNYALQPSEDYLNQHFPRPLNYVEHTTARPTNDTSVSVAKSGRTRETGTWVTTGKSVGALYEELRVQAGEYARLRNGCFDRAKVAKLSGSQSEAARLAAEGHRWNDLMFEKHGEAADAMYRERNPPANQRRGIIDLHGLHVSEALERLPDAINATDPHTRSVRILTGSGHHTKGTGKARLRPAVEKWLQENNYKFKIVEDKNSHVGAFVVQKK